MNLSHRTDTFTDSVIRRMTRVVRTMMSSSVKI